MGGAVPEAGARHSASLSNISAEVKYAVASKVAHHRWPEMRGAANHGHRNCRTRERHIKSERLIMSEAA